MKARAVVAKLAVIALLVTGCTADRGGGGTSLRELVGGSATAPVVDCRPGGEQPEDSIVALYRVRDGQPGQRCFGPHEGLVAVWSVMQAIAPPEVLGDIRYLALIDEDSDILAYTSPLAPSGDLFLLAFHTDLEAGSDLFTLTIAHELAHVVTSRPDQYRADWDPDEVCPTFDSYGACFTDAAIVSDWIDEFWPDDRLATVENADDPEVADGDALCAADPGLLGPYAASHPEEDLAEAFSAFVFDVEVPAAAQPRLDFFTDYPEMAQFRERARDKDFGFVGSEFEPCG